MNHHASAHKKAPGVNGGDVPVSSQPLNHSAPPRRLQPPFAKSALERLPKFFGLVVFLGDWNAAFADPRPTVLIPENADVLDYDWSKIFKATPKREGHKIVIVERGRVSEDHAKAVAMALLAIGFGRVMVSADGKFLEDGAPLRGYGVQP